MTTTPLRTEMVVFDLAALLHDRGPGRASSEAVFQRLRDVGIKVVVSTDLDRRTTREFLESAGWESSPLVNLIVTGLDVLQARPEPDMIFFAMRKLGVNTPAHVAKLGDSTLDITEARNAGCGVIVALSSGSEPAAELQAAEPTAVVDTLEDFVRLVVPFDQ